MYDPDLHLFVDDDRIHQIINLRRMLNQPAYAPEPVVQGDAEWELGCGIVAWGSVIREEGGRLRLWYLLNDYPNRQVANAYAESSDGIHWEKPDLGLIEWRGTKRNNLYFQFPPELAPGNVNAMDGYTMVRDDAAPAAERYAMIAFMHDDRMWARAHPDQHDRYITDEEIELARQASGLYLWKSPDGIHFAGAPEFIQPTYGDYLKVIRDHRNARWMLNTRAPSYRNPEAGHPHRRNVGLATSTDLRTWSPIESLFLNDADSAFGRLWEWHGLTPFNYGDMDLGFLDIQDSVFPTGTCELVSHRDGQPWRRVAPDRPFLDHGPEGSYYRSGGMPLHNAPILVNDELLLYFNTGSARRPDEQPIHPRVIGAAKIRLDRWVSLSHGHWKTGEPTGIVVTKPAVIAGDTLEVNVETRWESVPRGGSVRVGVLNPDATAVDGYGLEDCEPVQGNHLRARVRWGDHADLRALRDRTVMLVFSVAQGSLYSYRLAVREP